MTRSVHWVSDAAGPGRSSAPYGFRVIYPTPRVGITLTFPEMVSCPTCRLYLRRV